MKYLLLAVLVSCSSGPNIEKEVHEGLQRDYVVVDASRSEKPLWLADVDEWLDEKGMKSGKYRYFSFETTAKMDRNTACELAKANARVDLASEIVVFLDKSLGTSKSGQAGIDPNDPEIKSMREFMEVTLAQKTQGLLHGVQVYKKYWEKRKYLKEKGATRDYVGFVCAALVRMDKEKLKDAIRKAARQVTAKVDDPETKANVKKALKDVDENFVKARKGQI